MKTFTVFRKNGKQFIASPNNFRMLDILDEDGSYFGGWSTVRAFIADVNAHAVGTKKIVLFDIKK
jgi:hypothetical protein